MKKSHEPESGLAAELKSIEDVVRALKRMPSDRARIRVINHAFAFIHDRRGADTIVGLAAWGKDGVETRS